jgi:hypothetical protein
MAACGVLSLLGSAGWEAEGFYRKLLRGLMRAAQYESAAAHGLPLPAEGGIAAELSLGGAAASSVLRSAARGLLEGCDTAQGAAEHLAGQYQVLLDMHPLLTGGELRLAPRGGMRTASGSYFTPPDVVEGLLDLALEPLLREAESAGGIGEVRLCDPACGAGAFVAAAARRLAARAAATPTAAEMVQRCIYGVDADIVAVELCRFALWLQAGEGGEPWSFMADRIRHADALAGSTPRMEAQGRPGAFDSARGHGFRWHAECAEVFSRERSDKEHPESGWWGGFDLVIGNPPFLNRLEEATAQPQMMGFLRERFGGLVRCYADAATAFLVLGSQLLRPGGRLAMIQPQSLLAARDAGPARRSLAGSLALESIWFPRSHIFAASVHVCAPVLVRGGDRQGAIMRYAEGFAPCGPAGGAAVNGRELAESPTWSPVVADLLGVPSVRVIAAGTVGDVAVSTADFRDQYYGLRSAVMEEEPADSGDVLLVTTGLIDLAHCAWGERSTRFDGRAWAAPRVRLSLLTPEMQRWARSRLVPKILLATQTKVLEAAVDAAGEWLPTTPLISVMPRDPVMLWHIAAALVSPPLTALALERHAGVALSAGAIKLSAGQVGGLPLPGRSSAWDEGAMLFREASGAVDGGAREAILVCCGRVMCDAYSVSGSEQELLMGWWSARLGIRRQAPLIARA